MVVLVLLLGVISNAAGAGAGADSRAVVDEGC